MLTSMTANAIHADLGLSPVALDLGIFELRWYALDLGTPAKAGAQLERPPH